MDRDLRLLPGGDLVLQGLADHRGGALSEAALLVLVAAPRLRGLGLDVPEGPGHPAIPEHALFELLEFRPPRTAHGNYNALLGRVVSFAQAYPRIA